MGCLSFPNMAGSVRAQCLEERGGIEPLAVLFDLDVNVVLHFGNPLGAVLDRADAHAGRDPVAHRDGRFSIAVATSDASQARLGAQLALPPSIAAATVEA